MNSFISLNVTAGSVYYIKATAYGLGTGAYQASATFIAAPTSGQPSAPGDSFANAITLTAPQGSTVPSAIGDINPAYNADYYKYIATTTGVVNFAMAAINNSGVDSYLTLYNSNLVEIARNDDSNGTLNSFISLNVTANTIYYLKATAYGLGTGAYQVSATPGAPAGAGTSFATAITLTAGNPIADAISTALEADFYTYTAATAGVVNFAMNAISNSGVDSILTIYDSSFVQIARNDDSNGTLNSFVSLNVNANAIYYLKATAFGSGTGAYQVSATAIATQTVTNGGSPGDSFTNAITISASVINPIASYDGEINPAYNADYYKYIATTTGVINFAMAAINNSSVDSILTIYNSNEVQIARNDDSNGTLNSFISLNVTANAIYYLKATAYGSGTGAYRVSASSNSVFNSIPAGATFGTAINLAAGEPIEGVISTGLEADYYKYIATATGGVNFAMNAISNSGVDTYLTIYNSNFIEIAHDDDSGSGSNSLVSISVNANAIYYIKATAYGSGTGAYRISANNSDNQNTSPGASFATAINLTRAAPITGAISTALEADYYKYLGTATGSVNFAMNAINNSGVDTYLTIYNSEFIEIAHDDDSGPGLNSLVSISVNANAIYYIKATAYGSGTGDYRVEATAQTNDDVGGSLDATATLLSFTGNVASQSKTISSAMDVDVFRLTADVEGIFEIEVSPTNASALAPVIEVIGNDGTTLLQFSSANAGFSAFALPFLTLGQQVYVRVSGAGSTGNYTLQVTKPAAVVDFYANAFNSGTSQIPVGTITLSPGANSGSLTNANMDIESATDDDVFSFTTNRSGPIQVSVSKAVGSNIDTIVSILDASGNVFEFNDDSNGTSNSTVVFQANNNTLYYIRVSGYGGTIGRFDISVTDLTPTIAETDGAGTDLTNTTALTVDVPRTGNISSAGDQDFFSITASSTGVLTISLAAGVSSGLDTYLYLYNSDKVLILEDDDSGSGLNSLISTNVLTGQTYYLQASGFGSSTGAYTISASISAADDHANQAGESATRMVVSNNAVSNTAGTINPSTDNDVFLFKATADGSITINVTPTNNSALNSYLFVYDSTGNILLDYNDGNSSTDRTSLISMQVVRDEVYYFMVSGAEGTTGAYTISVTPVTDTVGNTIALATNLPISTTSTANTTVSTVNGSIGSTGDVDFYKVAIASDGRYAFRASANPTSNGLDTRIAVYSEDGQLIGENDDISASSLNSSLSLNLTAGEIVYVRVAGFGESTGDYIFDVVYLSAAIADDFGNTIDDAYSFVLDNAHSYTTSNASIQFVGDADVFHGVADLTGNITLVLTPSANLQGNIRAFVTRNGENIQVGSVNGSALGGMVNLTFPVSASENFYIEISGNNGTTGTYSVSVNNVIATNTVRPTDGSVIDRIAEELREEFTRIIAAASANADINATSQVIMTQLLAVIQRLIPGFTGLVGFFDPVDLNLTGGGGTIGSHGSNSTNSNPSASLSSRGALDLVVIPGAAAGQYNLNMAGVGSGTVHAGVAMVGANGVPIYPTVGGQSGGGIAATNVPKTGLNLVLDFGSNSGGGNGNGGGGNVGNGGGGDTAQSGPVAGSTTASASASASASSSSTASAATGLTSLAALANAITQSATASGADSATSAANLSNIASIALGLGSTAATLDEKQLAKDLGGDAPAGDLDLSGSDNLKTSGSFVLVTFAEAYKGFNQAVFSTLDAENQVVSEIANIFDKVLPALVPSEFENAVENLLVQTKKSLLEDGKATLLKTGDILADIIMSKLVKNLPAAQPAKNKVNAKVPSFEFVIANLVQQNKNENAAEENCFGEHTAITDKIPQCFEEIFNSVNRNTLDDTLSGPSILRIDQQNKTAEALGVIAGILLAPGVLSSTNGTQAPAFEKPKPRKQKS
ncbi:MAG: PPC domain-containing protein [Planctomycetota bacterium]